MARLRVAPRPDRYAVAIGQKLISKHPFRHIISNNPALPCQKQPAAIPGGQVQLVDNHHHGFSPVAQLPAEAEDFLLIEQIQPCRRFIQKQHRRLLGQHLGQQHPLPLAAGEGADRLVRHFQHPCVFHAGSRDFLVLLTLLLPPFPIWVASRHDNIPGRIIKGQLHLLLEIGNLFRQFPFLISPYLPACQQHPAGPHRQEAPQGFQQGALSGTILADDAHKLTFADAQADIVQYRILPVISGCNIFRLDNCITHPINHTHI